MIRRTLAVACALLLSACAVNETSSKAAPSPPEQVKTQHVDASLVEDFSSAPTLMQWSDRVFSGTVIEKTETLTPGGSSLPGTVFRVKVDQWYGAPFGDEVLVYQDGGFDEAENTVYVFNNDQLLEVGKQYMLAGRAGGPEGAEEAVVLVPSFGTVDAGSPKMAELVHAAEVSARRRS